MSWVKRRWQCFREGHDWLDKTGLPGANQCVRCGRLVDW